MNIKSMGTDFSRLFGCRATIFVSALHGGIRN